MQVSVPTVTKIIGCLLAGFLWIHYLGMPYGLLAGVATALVVLP